MLQKLDEFEDRGLIVCLIIAMDLYSQENLAEICGFVREALKSATGEAFNSLLREDGSGAYSYRGRQPRLRHNELLGPFRESL
jgi:hypothetical protein